MLAALRKGTETEELPTWFAFIFTLALSFPVWPLKNAGS